MVQPGRGGHHPALASSGAHFRPRHCSSMAANRYVELFQGLDFLISLNLF
ncbi:hypothetical protein [Herbaspirillum huttiense]|uniref:Uncharacterized protein n=2 Tax=Herbaspirillum huttiense TaxID=863372 RepID=A0AAJ2LTL5_9BURK|nr:hypothetical protein [Herbaspirillum huttiense]MDR9836420.1 hypothetical protein [Herbaspirillum huttiense]UWE14492.1 hypothetical protein NY669_15345 [Herbaspirillum huttiense]